MRRTRGGRGSATKLPNILKSPGGVRQVQGPAALAASRKLLFGKLDQAIVLGHGLPCLAPASGLWLKQAGNADTERNVPFGQFA